MMPRMQTDPRWQTDRPQPEVCRLPQTWGAYLPQTWGSQSTIGAEQMSLSPNEAFATIATHMGGSRTSMLTAHEPTIMPSTVSCQPMPAPVSCQKLHSKNKSVERRNSELEEGRRLENTARRGGSAIPVAAYDFQETTVGPEKAPEKETRNRIGVGRIRPFR
jgi:hypothetical protein